MTSRVLRAAVDSTVAVIRQDQIDWAELAQHLEQRGEPEGMVEAAEEPVTARVEVVEDNLGEQEGEETQRTVGMEAGPGSARPVRIPVHLWLPLVQEK